jgi:hypothetical protein
MTHIMSIEHRQYQMQNGQQVLINTTEEDVPCDCEIPRDHNWPPARKAAS